MKRPPSSVGCSERISGLGHRQPIRLGLIWKRGYERRDVLVSLFRSDIERTSRLVDSWAKHRVDGILSVVRSRAFLGVPNQSMLDVLPYRDATAFLDKPMTPGMVRRQPAISQRWHFRRERSHERPDFLRRGPPFGTKLVSLEGREPPAATMRQGWP